LTSNPMSSRQSTILGSRFSGFSRSSELLKRGDSLRPELGILYVQIQVYKVQIDSTSI
jgi:hypothetical protein